MARRVRRSHGTLALAIGLGATAPAWAGEPIPLDAVRIFLEFNSVDDDLGVQVFLDGEDWRLIKIKGPSGKEFLQIKAKAGLKELGLTELFFESAEPSPPEVLAVIPEGDYAFEGKTTEGDKLEGTATLSHALLEPATILTPTDDPVDPDATIITWSAVPGVASYEIIIEQEDLGVEATIPLSAAETSLHVPPELLEPGTQYKVEVLAIAPSGNKTINERLFDTLP
jgi:hypothetical protein